MKLFKKKTEETAQSDVLDIEKLLTGDRKPVKPAKKPIPTQSMPTQKLLIVFGGAGLVLVFALITMIVAISVGRRTDPDFGFRDLFVPTTASPTQQTTTEPATLSTPPATTLPSTTLPAVKPTERPTTPTEPVEPPLRFDKVKRGDVTYLVPNKKLELSLRQYYCTSPSLPIPAKDAPAEEWLLLFHSMLIEPDSWYNQALTSHYTSPEEIYMDPFLCQGITQGGSFPDSYPEAQWLSQFFKPEDLVFRLPASDINSLVGVYFGTTIDDHEMPYYRFNEQTGCYYFANPYALYTTILGIVDYEWLENGDVCVRYATPGPSGANLNQVVLRPVGDYFRIVSNLPVQTEPVIVQLEDIPDITDFVNDPTSAFIEGGYFGYAQWGNGMEFYIRLPLLEPFCEGAKAINAEIKSIYQPIIDEIRQHVIYQTASMYWKVDYETYVSEEDMLLSIVISERMAAGDNIGYRVFNLDLATGQLLEQDEMVRRYTGMSYPEFLLQANYTIVNHLRKENPAESENVTNWLSGLAGDVMLMNGHKLILDGEGTLTLLNSSVRDWIGFQKSLQIPFDPNACGEELSDWERESYEWLFSIRTDGAYATTMCSVLEKTFFFDPERFLRYLSGMSDEHILRNAGHLSSVTYGGDLELIHSVCKQYLEQDDTAKAAQVIRDQFERYADDY